MRDDFPYICSPKNWSLFSHYKIFTVHCDYEKILFFQRINEKPQIVQDYESAKGIPNNQIQCKMERALGNAIYYLLSLFSNNYSFFHQLIAMLQTFTECEIKQLPSLF